jgi:transposase
VTTHVTRSIPATRVRRSQAGADVRAVGLSLVAVSADREGYQALQTQYGMARAVCLRGPSRPPRVGGVWYLRNAVLDHEWITEDDGSEGSPLL